jgi:hypothetical protein
MSNKRPKRLEVRNQPSHGLEIHAEIGFEPNCVEFRMKKGFQPIVQCGACSKEVVISYDPWIQFPDKDWTEMLAQVYEEMVDLWNEKYALAEEAQGE